MQFLRQVGALVVTTGTEDGEPIVRVSFVKPWNAQFWQRWRRHQDISPAEAATLGAILLGYAIQQDTATRRWAVAAIEQLDTIAANAEVEAEK